MSERRDIDGAMTEVTSAQHPPRSEWFWAELGMVRERWDIPHHPFYARWAACELSLPELRLYAEEYDHLVVAIAAVARNAANKAGGLLRDTLGLHASALETDVGLWRDFAKGTGWCSASAWYYAEDPLPETVACAGVWIGEPSRPLTLDLVTLYAIEDLSPGVARTALDGLIDHYGLASPATRYLRLQAQLGGDHAGLAQAALAGLLDSEDPFALIGHAESVQRAYRDMLDGLMEELQR